MLSCVKAGALVPSHLPSAFGCERSKRTSKPGRDLIQQVEVCTDAAGGGLYRCSRGRSVLLHDVEICTDIVGSGEPLHVCEQGRGRTSKEGSSGRKFKVS